MTHRILFVCLGNICRSPAAEAVFRALMPEAHTDSAGTSDWHVGRPPYAPMQEAAGARGIDMSDLRGRQFSRADFDLFDLIIAMDASNMADIEAQRPAGHATSVRLLTDFASESGMDHVPDPYYTRDFDQALDLIEQGARGLQNSLRGK
ncbi:low molecular weight protein-tyrosine-phosphatase [Ruegeria hyattellae]|uniref:low molecular weight protein-tyrosine-phosphatase n=1 Tax=Ruegeria hyattellae TaxID=3233337 RepID=UPI00355C34D5